MHPKIMFRFARIMLPAYIRSRFRKIPLFAHLTVTRKCNMNCSYCFVHDENRKELDTDGMKRAIDHLHMLGCRFISFFGGEPTLRKDFPELLNYAYEKGMLCHLSTNGTLLTDAYLKGIQKLDAINLSVDSLFNYSESDKIYIRQKKILRRLLEAKRKYHIELTCNMVLTSKNIDHALPTVQKLGRLKIPISVSIIIPNTYTEKKQEGSLFFKDKKKLYRVLRQLRKEKNVIDPNEYFDDAIRYYDKGIDWYCCAGEYSMSVDCDGHFQFCCGLAPEKFKIWDIGPDYFKKLERLRKKRLSVCKKTCYANCLYDTSYFIRHPLSMLGI